MTSDPGPLHEQARRLAAGEVSSVELVTRALDDAEATQSTLNAFKLLRRERALEEARRADERIAAGETAPLLGVPTAVKDDTDLAGHPTAFGCAGDFVPKTVDAELPRRLRAAGAVIIGKTNTPELGQWPFTEGVAFGRTRNPWDLAMSPGGSSGGASAAVSAGIVAAAIGSDGAGSVRIPASWTNLVGIKPQRGRISTWPEPEAFHGITVNGPLARTVADAALLLDATAGLHHGDLHTPPAPTGTFVDAARREPGRLRIALSTRVPFSVFPARLDPQIRAGIERLATVLTALGHDVIEADPAYGLAGLSFLPRSHAGLRTWLARVPDPSLLDPRTRENCRNARVIGGPLLPLARGAERLLQRRIGGIFDRVDVVLAPTTAQGPLAVGITDDMSGTALDRAIIAACPYTWPWNVLGWPGVNVPAGFTDAGHPFGAQLLGPANSEALLISLAAQLEAVERWHEAVPRTPSGRTSRDAPAATRDRILDAALRVMGEHGIAGLTNRRVAAAAGLSLGSLTYHFPSQTQLLRESLTRFVADEILRIETLAEGIDGVDGVGGAAAAVERTLAAMTFGAAELGVYEVYLQAARDPELRGAARDCFRAYEALAATLLGRLGVTHAATTAPHVVALVLGAQLRRAATGAEDVVGIAAGLVQLVAGSGAPAG